MTETSGKGRIKTAILFVALTIQAMNSIALILSSVARLYTEAGPTRIQLVFTLLTVASVAGVLLSGKLASAMTKKTIILTASALLVVGAFVGWFLTDSLGMIYLASVIIGLGNGMLRPLASALVTEHFTGDERTSMVGVQAVFTNIGGTLFNLIGGILAGAYWKRIYLLFLVFLPVAVVVQVCLPRGTAEKASSGDKPKLSTFSYGLGILALLFGLCWMTFMTNISSLVEFHGLGNAKQAGYVTTVYSVGAIVINLLLKKLIKGVGKHCLTLAFLLMAISCWIYSYAETMPLLLIAGLALGLGFGIFLSVSVAIIPFNVHPATITMSISLATAGVSLGGFFTPYVITNIAGAFGGLVTTRFLVAAIFSTVLTVIVAVITAKAEIKTSR